MRIPFVPQCVLQFVKCGCRKSKCKGNRSCSLNNVQCTELCACEADAEKCKKCFILHHSNNDELGV